MSKKFLLGLAFLAFFVYVITNSSLLALLIVTPIVVHEMGHVTAVNLFGEEAKLETASTTHDSLNMSPFMECIIALSGATANLLVAFFIWYVDSGYLYAENFVVINAAACVFHLLPQLSGDGKEISAFISDSGRKVQASIISLARIALCLLGCYLLIVSVQNIQIPPL